jgi:hypothetical protein
MLKNSELVLTIMKQVSEFIHLVLETEKSYQKLKLKLQNIDVEAIFDHINQKKVRKLNFHAIQTWLKRENMPIHPAKLEKMYERWQRIGCITTKKDSDPNGQYTQLEKEILRQK